MTRGATAIRYLLSSCFSRRAVLLATAALAPAIAFPFLRAQWQNRAVNEALNALRARGEPVTAADLDAIYERPVAQANTTDLYACDEKVWAIEVTAAAQKLEIVDQELVLPRLAEPWQRSTGCRSIPCGDCLLP
ncbi:MAG TPA: hypothetical protein VGN12_18780 [Pirellulales bacterium]|jgi:hypothetical protein